MSPALPTSASQFTPTASSAVSKTVSLRLTRLCALISDKDILGWTPPAGMKDDLGHTIEQREYNQKDIDRILVLNRRTRLVANRVMQYLRATNPFDKSIIFCEDIEHAERMRAAIVNAADQLALDNPKYVMRITGDSVEGKGGAGQLKLGKPPPLAVRRAEVRPW